LAATKPKRGDSKQDREAFDFWWEYGHVAAFTAWLPGTIALHLAILRDVPGDPGLSDVGNASSSTEAMLQ
jgi:hypothetical protein